MKRTLTLLLIPLVLVALLAGLVPARALDRQARLDVMAAVVQISWVTVKDGHVYGVGVGSGTIVSPDGLILTNCHVADPILFGMSRDQVPQIDYLGVSLTVRSDQPPQAAYLAEVVAADPDLDLAVIRITRNLDLSPVAEASLNLPYVERSDSNLVEVGDELNIFGYPGIGGETVTFTRGVVSGFSLDAAITGRAWIKTDATIAGGNSGGTGVDADGYLVGVPTRAGAGGGADYVDCRPLADTNGDGRIDDGDSCVPIGGFINALRPVRLAEPLIESARLGLSYQSAPKKSTGPAPAGQPRFTNLFFAPGVTEFNQPTSVITNLPSGARSLYLFFDYENMAGDMTLEMKVKVNGQDAPNWGLPAELWSGDAAGNWWVGWDDVPFGDGTYDLTLLVDGAALARATIAVGGKVQAGPTFSNLRLSLQKDAQDQPLEPTVLFPEGTQKLYAFFDFANMSNSLPWNHTWLQDGDVALSKDVAWDSGRSGHYVLWLTSERGMPAGAYRLKITIDGELAAVSNFWVTPGTTGGAAFDPIVFAEGVDRGGNPLRPASSFGSGLPELHAFSGYGGMADGLNFTANWYVDDQLVLEWPVEWDGGESGTWHDYLYSKAGTLPDGEYGLELLVEDQVLQRASVTVGAGTMPKPQPTPRPADGVQIQGTITDLDTGRPIAGAYFFVLNPGITVASFQWTDAEIYTAAETDRTGFYRLPDLLERGQCYSMIMAAQDYWSYAEDDVCIGRNAAAVVELPVRLEKK